jgi:hypothetical protein
MQWLSIGERGGVGCGFALDRWIRVALTTVSACLGLLLFSSPAFAAIAHEYESAVSVELAKGVSKAFCETLPETEPPCVSGALTGASAIAAAGKRLWVADQVGDKGRVDLFSAETGVFEGPQLNEGEGAGSLGGGLAVGHAEFAGTPGEQVYVESGGNLAVFDGATGKLLSVWTGANTPAKSFGGGKRAKSFGGEKDLAGSFGGEKGVAVNQSALSPDKGDVYVISDHGENAAGNAVDVFDPEKEVTKDGEEPAKPVTVIEGTCAPGEDLPCTGNLTPFVFPHKVAVSPLNGDVYVADIIEDNTSGHRSVVDVFEPTGVPGGYKFSSTITEANGALFGAEGGINGLAVDGEGDLYIALGNGSANTNKSIVYQFNAVGTLVSRLEGTPTEAFSDVTSVAVDSETGGLFVGDGGSGVPVRVFGRSVTIPDVALTAASEVHATHVVLNGTVNPDEAGAATCEFEYGTSLSYGAHAECEGPGSVATPIPGGPGDDSPVPVHSVTLAALEPDTTYFYRLRALNSTGVPSDEDAGQVTTSGPGLDGELSSEVASSAVTLDARIDPHGSNASYYFQYSETSTEACEATASFSSCAAIPAPPGEALGSASGEQEVSQRVQGLVPGRVYHYRVVVLSEAKPGETEVFPEADRTFTTQPEGSASGTAGLPDDRQWELVSPPDKHGALILPILGGGEASGAKVIESSLSGDALTYVASNPVEENAAGYHAEEQILATRGSGGWSSQNIGLPRSNPEGPGNGDEYRFFSEDLSLGLAEPIGGEFTSLKPDVFPPDSEGAPYVRHDLTCQTTPSTCFQPLVTGAPGYADVPEGTRFGSHGNSREGVEFAGASPDLTHVVMYSETPLKPGAAGHALYEWSAGAPFGEQELQPVSVLPESEGGAVVSGELGEATGGASHGFSANAPWAVSGDGSRVFWSAGGRLYLRDMTHGQSLVGGQEIPGETLAVGSAAFQVASSDGSRVFYTEGGALDVCEVGEEPSGELVCGSRNPTPWGGVVGHVLGASEDGSYVYFVSNSVLGDGGARGATAGNCQEEAGDEAPAASVGESCNVYVAHYDGASRVWEAPVFIGALSGNDGADWRPALAFQTARVSPDGRWLAFMSDRSLTGYDNHDAHSGKPDEEVFLYHAPERLGAGSGALVCASCNPTGAQPDGVEQGDGLRLSSGFGAWLPTAWLAANIPGWTELALGKARYQSRFLSDEGRLFFNSSDALVPQAVNSSEDVYEWEPAGTEPGSPSSDSCTEGAPGFVASEHGCVSLISSGTSAQESAFLDASANGDHVFFLTSERLVSQDTDTAFDVYDAHVCSSGSPCVSPAVSPPSCTTADACRAASPPQPGVFGAPASATFSGPGNLAPAPPPLAKAKTAAQIKAERLAKALKACRKDKDKGKRQKCEKAARKAFGAKASKSRASARRANNDRGASR